MKDAREKFGPGKDRRDVMIHCQTVREDQLDMMKESESFLRCLECIVSIGATGTVIQYLELQGQKESAQLDPLCDAG